MIKTRLDIGCRDNKIDGCIGIDIKDYSNLYPKGKFIQMDINEGFGEHFPDNSVDEVYAYDVFEHLSNLEFVLEEIYRVCKDGAIISVKVPHFNISVMDEHHVRHFSYSLAFDKHNCQGNHTFIIRKRYLSLNQKYFFPWRYIVEWFLNLHPCIIQLFELTMLKHLIPSATIMMELEAVK